MSGFIALDGVSHRYGGIQAGPEGILAIQDLSITVGRGEFAAVVGPSGCGKSTLMKLVTGLQFPFAGHVIVGGQEAWRVADRLHRLQVGVILTGTHRLPLRRYDALDSSYSAAVKLAEAGVPFVISTAGDSFDTTNLRNLPYQAATAVAFGLSREEALKAITLYPAKLFGVADQYGSLQVGKQATLFIANGDPLEASTSVEAAFIEGREIDLSNRQTRLYEKYRAKYAQ